MDDKSETADGEIDSRSNNRTGEFGRGGNRVHPWTALARRVTGEGRTRYSGEPTALRAAG